MAVLSLVLLAAVIFALANLVLLPLWLAATSLAGAFSLPGEFVRIAANRRLRQNHALEHATLNVLEERLGPQRLAGIAREDGFVLKGYGNPEAVRLAAEEGLARLKRGERRLAFHPRCGTSRAAASLVTSVVLLVLLLGFGYFTLPGVVLAMVFANLGGPAFGRVFQRLLTTNPDVANVFITGFECGLDRRGWMAWVTGGGGAGGLAGLPIVCLVRTTVPRSCPAAR